MNQKDLDLVNAAAGLPTKRKRRKPRVDIGLETPDDIHMRKLRACERVVDSVGGTRSKAARILKIHERTLYKWLKEIKEIKKLGAWSNTYFEGTA